MNDSKVNITFEGSTAWGLSPLDICALVISLLFSFPTYLYVLWLIVKGTGSGVASELFNLNLSVCEIGISLISVLSVIAHCTGFQPLVILTWFLLGLMITGRPLFQCLICVERYLAVVHPVTFLKSKPLRYRLICCAFAWIITLGSCLYCMFTVEHFDYVYFINFNLIQNLLFFSIQLFCLVAVLRALKQSGPGDRRREEDNHMKRRAFYLILITTVTMSVMYMPYIVAGLIFILMHHFIVYLFSFGFLCYVLAGFVQPLLYLRRAGKLSCRCSL